jgi:pimeloyl-ACP methyl ester carboxylesterase
MAGLAALLSIVCGPARAQQRIEVPTRPGVTEPVYVTEVPHPVASLVLLPGGQGVYAEGRNNFLRRVAPDFAAAGMTVAIPDAPSDHARGLDAGFRAGEAHAQDLRAVVEMLRGRTLAPVWLIGTSRGTVSAANGAVRIGPPLVAGVVLTSSVWAGGMAPVPLGQLRVPVLVVHNRDDRCQASPFVAAEPSLAAMTQAPARQFLPVSGGLSISPPCQARSPHGYLGIEQQVVPPIIAWIKAHPPAAR